MPKEIPISPETKRQIIEYGRTNYLIRAKIGELTAQIKQLRIQQRKISVEQLASRYFVTRAQVQHIWNKQRLRQGYQADKNMRNMFVPPEDSQKK